MTGSYRYYYMEPSHVIAVSIALSVVDIIAVALRVWARKIQNQPLKADDWLMIPATLVTVGIGASQVYGVSHRALGYPIDVPAGYTGDPSALNTPQLRLKSQLEWISELMLPVALGCLKASFLFFYLRIFATKQNNTMEKVLMGSIIFVALWVVAFFFATLFECGSDFQAIWSSEKEYLARCSNTIPLVLTLCITDFLTDIYIIGFPVRLVIQLHVSTGKKVSICFMFLLGAGTVALSLTRFIMMAGSFVGNFNITSDNILGVTACMYWGMAECGVGVIAACLPTIQTLFRRLIWEPAAKSSIFNSRSTKSSEFQKASYNKVNVNSRSGSPTESSTMSQHYMHDLRDSWNSHTSWDDRSVGPDLGDRWKGAPRSYF
ncbi:hypothetical protein M426DRAFT_211617 [Hypoxylon sp. CI-4A]|nr:hypothetical protein M426DRAFT_211617 [Hypoxylon sp. CI-4A]